VTAPIKIDPAELLELRLATPEEEEAEGGLIAELIDAACAGAPTPGAAMRALVYAITMLADDSDESDAVLAAVVKVIRAWRTGGRVVAMPGGEHNPLAGWQDRVLKRVGLQTEEAEQLARALGVKPVDAGEGKS